MHYLPPEKALLYWIPSMCVAIGMFITLLCSFWKFHKRKMLIRKLQMEYIEVNLSMKRPRIGAIRCNTHGAKWDDLMASLSSSAFPHIRTYFRQQSKQKSPRIYDTLYEVDEGRRQSDSYKELHHGKSAMETLQVINPYYEQRGYVESERPLHKCGSKRKKKKKQRLNLHYKRSSTKDTVDVFRLSSPRRLPVIENHLWSGLATPVLSQHNQLPVTSAYFNSSFSEDVDTRGSPSETSESDKITMHERIYSTSRHHKETPHRRSKQEERIFWVLASDIKQSAV